MESDAFLITDPINIRGKGVILITAGHKAFFSWEREEGWGETRQAQELLQSDSEPILKLFSLKKDKIGHYSKSDWGNLLSSFVLTQPGKASEYVGVFIMLSASRWDAGRRSDRDSVVVVATRRLITLTLSFQHTSKQCTVTIRTDVKWTVGCAVRWLLQVSKMTAVLLFPSSIETVKKKKKKIHIQ